MKSNPFKGSEIIKFIGEKNCIALGNINLEFTKVSPINASSEGDLAFCNLKDKSAVKLLQASKASIILCPKDLLKYDIQFKNKLIIAADNPRLWFIRCIQRFFPLPTKTGVHPTATIGEKCDIGEGIYMGTFVCVGNNVKIGNECKIHSGVHIYDNVTIGNHVVINSGCVIGADGFGYERNESQILEKFPHVGSVIIEDSVEIGANTCIDRGTLDYTLIGEGTKIDNFVHIGHNARVGKHCVITAMCMIGRSSIGDFSWIGPCSCVKPGKNIGKNSFIGLGSVVTNDVPDNTTVAGAPAREINEFKKYLNFIKDKI